MVENEYGLRVVKYYGVFDTAYLVKAEALKVLKGWEHKEEISSLFVVFEDKDTPNKIDLLESIKYDMFKSEVKANEYITEEIAWRTKDI